MLPTELYKSLTWDRGCELSNHKDFMLVTGLPRLTPNIDRFAEQGYQFRNAHVNTAICQC